MSVDPQVLGQLVEPGAPAVAAAPATATRTRRLPLPLLGLIPPLAVLVLGEVAVRQGWISPNLLPAPSDVLRTLLELGAQGLATHVLASSARVAAGFAIGGGLALAVGSKFSPI